MNEIACNCFQGLLWPPLDYIEGRLQWCCVSIHRAEAMDSALINHGFNSENTVFCYLWRRGQEVRLSHIIVKVDAEYYCSYHDLSFKPDAKWKCSCCFKTLLSHRVGIYFLFVPNEARTAMQDPFVTVSQAFPFTSMQTTDRHVYHFFRQLSSDWSNLV